MEIRIQDSALYSPHHCDSISGSSSPSPSSSGQILGQHGVGIEARHQNRTPPSSIETEQDSPRLRQNLNVTERLKDMLSPTRAPGSGGASATADKGRDDEIQELVSDSPHLLDRNRSRQSTHSDGLRSSTPSLGDAKDIESGMPLHDCQSKVMAFLKNLSVVQEVKQFDDAEFIANLRAEQVAKPASPESKTLLAALDERIEDLRSHLNQEATTPAEREFLAEAKRYLEPLIESFKKDINTLQHDSGAAKRMFQGALTLLLYPLPLATLFAQKTGAYAAFSIASYLYTAIQLVSLMRRPTTDAKLFKKHSINRHSLTFFISLVYAAPTFYKKAQPLQHNAGFVAGAAVAQGAMMLGLRLGQDMMDSYRLRFNTAFNGRRDLPSGFKEAIDGILTDLRDNLKKVDGFLGDFQSDRQITIHMDRQITFFKQDMEKIITGLERLLATGQGGEVQAAPENTHGHFESVRRALASSFMNNPALKGKLTLAIVGLTVLGSNIALMRNNGLALPDFIADAAVSSMFLLSEALSPHVSLKGMNDSVSDTVGGMTIGLPFSIAAEMNSYMSDPKNNPSGFATGAVCYTAAYMLFGRVAGDVLAKGLMATGGALGWGQRQMIQLARSAMAMGFKMIAGQAPQIAERGQAETEMRAVPDQPLLFTAVQLESAERNLVDTLEQIDDEWHDAREHWEGSSEGVDDGSDRWSDAEPDLPAEPTPSSGRASFRSCTGGEDS